MLDYIKFVITPYTKSWVYHQVTPKPKPLIARPQPTCPVDSALADEVKILESMCRCPVTDLPTSTPIVY